MNIARALYFGADIVILDDPLSAGVSLLPINTALYFDEFVLLYSRCPRR